jgi:hypothetical protein
MAVSLLWESQQTVLAHHPEHIVIAEQLIFHKPSGCWLTAKGGGQRPFAWNNMRPIVLLLTFSRLA